MLEQKKCFCLPVSNSLCCSWSAKYRFRLSAFFLFLRGELQLGGKRKDQIFDALSSRLKKKLQPKATCHRVPVAYFWLGWTQSGDCMYKNTAPVPKSDGVRADNEYDYIYNVTPLNGDWRRRVGVWQTQTTRAGLQEVVWILGLEAGEHPGTASGSLQ